MDSRVEKLEKEVGSLSIGQQQILKKLELFAKINSRTIQAHNEGELYVAPLLQQEE